MSKKQNVVSLGKAFDRAIEVNGLRLEVAKDGKGIRIYTDDPVEVRVSAKRPARPRRG